MISLNFAKTLGRPIMLVSAGLIFHSAAALAANSIGDSQTHARELLGGMTLSRTTVSAARSTGAASLPRVEPQEQARRLILGIQSSDRTAAFVRLARTARVNGNRVRRAPTDAQVLAKQMILGPAG